jgi:arylsulfatase
MADCGPDEVKMKPACNTAGVTFLFKSLSVVTVLIVCSACVSPSFGEVKPNIVLVVIDALRPDHLGCYGHVRPTSPTIDEIASDGVVFETALSHAPLMKCSFSSMLTSLYPFQHGVIGWDSVLPDSLVTLAEVLAQDGYTTACVMNTPALGSVYGVLQGFDEVVVTEKVDRDALATSTEALDIVRRAGTPFFLMVHYSDTHRPYRPPAGYVGKVRLLTDPHPYSQRSFTPDDVLLDSHSVEVAKDIVLYDACVRRVDDGIREILACLEGAGLRANTLIIVTSDHGQGFGEHRKGFHTGSTYEEAISVPLIMAHPKTFGKPARIARQVRHVDLLPTILEIAGTTDYEYREGTSLIDLVIAGGYAEAEAKFLPVSSTLCESTMPRAPVTRCIRTEDWKLMFESLTFTRELYNLRSDPGETENLAGRGLAIEDSLIRAILRVPGTELGGWRIGLTGAGPNLSFDVEVTLPEQTGFTTVKRFTKRPGEGVDMSDDGNGFRLKATGRDLNPVFFAADPPEARVRLKVAATGMDPPEHVHVGETGMMPIGEEFVIDTGQAFGLTEDFLKARTSGRPGAYIWWFPGEEWFSGSETVDLTPEQKKRLRSLGYIQ